MKRLLAIAALLIAGPAVTAQQALAQEAAGACTSAGPQAPLANVLKTVGERYKGRHLNTTMGDAAGRCAYFVQWQLGDGHVVVIVVDAASGQIIGRQGG